MSTQTRSDLIFDATTADFETTVLARSAEVPVMVDFWAPWCGPCRSLGPVLERITLELDGAVVLAKVNSDENQEIAARYRVQGIPSVQLFRHGEVVDRFVGALPEAHVRAFLRPHCPTPADQLVAEALARLDTGETTVARELLDRALLLDSGHSGAHLGAARAALAAGDPEAVERHAGAIPASDDEFEAAQALLKALDLVRQALEVGDVASCRERLSRDPADIEARYALGGHAVAAGDPRAALEHFLAVARQDRGWNDQAGRRAMLTVFELIGARHPLADEYRDRLATIYY
ncbi:MAG: thioredoxin [Acidobacteria bacterium]|nr:thioredoxin [Acidobacteriota bacterium]